MAKDMRSWINQLEEAGELLRVSEEIDPKVEMGGILATSKEKALLFENVKGYSGWKVLGQAPANMRHVALAFGVEKTKVIEYVAKTLDQATTRCKILDSGPIKEVVWTDSKVRLSQLPIHKSGEKDKSPYITAGLCIVKDPETGVRNMSINRIEIKNDTRTGIMMQPERHNWLIYQKYEAVDKPMPIAVAVGHHPLYYFAACYAVPFGVDELEVAGSLLGEPVELVKCETLDLEVPAHAEIIIEGEIPPKYREDEGPFCEFHGYYAAVHKNPVINVSAISMRKGAVYKTLQHAPPREGEFYTNVPMAAALLRDLRHVGGYVDLKDIRCRWGGPFGVIIQMTPRFYGEAKHVLLAALSSSYLHHKIAIAVDEDVDINDPEDIAWAIMTRVDPATDVTIISGVRGHPLDISQKELLNPELSMVQRLGSRMLIDATKPPTSDPKSRILFDRAKPPSHAGFQKLFDQEGVLKQ